MRHVLETHEYKRCMRRAAKGQYSWLLDEELPEIVDALANDIPLPYSYHDHALHGNLEGHRECHVKPDFLLIYTYEGDDVLRLEKLGSHSELFGL